ncbi:MAG: hypothetical protein PHG40_00875 [Candidatus Omnitrophica bacterium]|nr:hypothetical protein [Candidatus Omnitrophota bacterium]
MRKILLIIFLLLIFSFVKSKAEETSIGTAGNQIETNVVLLQNKISALEQKISTVDKELDRVLQTSQHIWQNILTAVLTIMVALLGANIFNTFFYTRTKINKAEGSLRNEIAEKLKQIKGEFQDNVDNKFNKLKDEYDIKFDELDADICDAIGRNYVQDNQEVGAMWFARCVDKYMDPKRYPNLDKKTDDWIKVRMEWVVDNLKKGDKLDEPRFIAELQEIISRIDENKYKEQKEEIQKALKENINKTV